MKLSEFDRINYVRIWREEAVCNLIFFTTSYSYIIKLDNLYNKVTNLLLGMWNLIESRQKRVEHKIPSLIRFSTLFT